MRSTRVSTLSCMFLVAVLAMAPAFGRSAVEQDKIDYLIATIADLHDARFIRNGNEYDARRAVDHLRLKLRYAGDRIVTAEDFIADCATGSSISGEPYRIKFADGRITPVAMFLRGKLAVYRTHENNPISAPGDR